MKFNFKFIQNHKDKRTATVYRVWRSKGGGSRNSDKIWQEVECEERLRHKDILGSIAKGRVGLGFFPSTHTISAKGKERHHLILEEVREGVEEGRYSKMIGLSQQGAWTRWEDVEKKRVTWSDCWRPDFNEIWFLIKSVYDVLPSPTNLHI